MPISQPYAQFWFRENFKAPGREHDFLLFILRNIGFSVKIAVLRPKQQDFRVAHGDLASARGGFASAHGDFASAQPGLKRAHE